METTNTLSSRALQYYVMATQWAADLEFFKIETAFFHHLLEDYQVYFSCGVCMEKLGSINQKLLKLEADQRDTENLLTSQLKQLELMAEDIIPEDTESLTAQQVRLENLTHNLLKEYQDVKKILFAQIEGVIHQTNRDISAQIISAVRRDTLQ